MIQKPMDIFLWGKQDDTNLKVDQQKYVIPIALYILYTL